MACKNCGCDSWQLGKDYDRCVNCNQLKKKKIRIEE